MVLSPTHLLFLFCRGLLLKSEIIPFRKGLLSTPWFRSLSSILLLFYNLNCKFGSEFNTSVIDMTF